MLMDNRLREQAEDLGADFYGVADLTPARPFIEEQGGPMPAAYPRGIAVGVTLMHSLVDQLPRHTDRVVAINFRHHAYDLVNQRLDHLTARLASRLQREGHRTLPVPASQTVDGERLCALISHKLVAHLAGLGWIGKNCTLVTPEVGPRVRWATILTTAPLSPTGAAAQEQCGTCRECVDACPAHAFTGEPFRPEEPREVRFDAHACRQYQQQVQEQVGVPVCGICVYSCPHGQP